MPLLVSYVKRTEIPNAGLYDFYFFQLSAYKPYMNNNVISQNSNRIIFVDLTKFESQNQQNSLRVK